MLKTDLNKIPSSKKHIFQYEGLKRETETILCTLTEFRQLIDWNNQPVLVIDENVLQLYENYLGKLTPKTSFFTVAATEENKDTNQLQHLIEFLIDNNVTRNREIIAVGGGITLDLAAFAASIFKRGVKLSLVPTTLLAMIDAAFGGKTGVNHLQIKNLLGAFYPANKVYIITELLNTLPQKELANGFAELLKIALIKPSSLYDRLLTDNFVLNSTDIMEAIKLKMEICLEDPEDRGERQKLNLGHTFGHVIESATDYMIPHGTAVALGIRCAALLSNELGFITESELNSINNLLDLYKFPPKLETKYCEAIKMKGSIFLQSDKKRNKGLQLILFNGCRETFIYQLTDEQRLIDTILAL